MEGAAGDRSPSKPAGLIAEILEVADRLRMRLDAPCHQHGVSASRFAVLMVVHDSGSDGSSQKALAARLGLSESNVSVLVEGLRKAGLLFRFRSKTDRRRSVLLLSESGTEVLTVLTKARDAEAASLLSALTSRQMSELRRLLDLLGAQIDEVDAPKDHSEWRRAS